MPPQKKKIDTYKSDITDSRPLDSYFINKTSNASNAYQSYEPIPVNITSLEIPKYDSRDTINLSRENILKNLIQHKITYSINDIKIKIEMLSENELTEIFKIIKNNNEKYSTNKNGIFINLSTLKKSTVQELSNFIYFCENNDKQIDKEEEERSHYKDMIIE